MGIHLEGRHRVALLIAREEEPPRRVNRETARIVGVAPGFARPGQFAAGTHRERGDGVVPARSRVNEPAVRRDCSSEHRLLPPKPLGSTEMDCFSFIAPVFGSKSATVTIPSCSCKL